MRPGRLVGRAILVWLDALVAGVGAGVLAYLAVPILFVGDRVVVATVVAGVAIAVSLAVALALARRGRRPFPATRLVYAAGRRLPPWL